ncbi:ankyrin repeat domain-containing protein [Citrifermentans bremense]|uniref:ankyrin repeat domain-containing protein n=1 Tax=Citrifermentans bremense TaxID=60035 RepID=UPI00047CAF17|nr:ankyrin repeat domain-containing protein [Citrifermentans bremense]
MRTIFPGIVTATKVIGVIIMMTNIASAAPTFNLRPPQYYFDNPQTLDLLAAAMAGDTANAKECVVKGANPNDEGPMRSQNYRLRLLHYAVAAKSPGTARVLLGVGADPELNGMGFGNAFEFAITLQYINMMTCLLELRPIDTLSRITIKNMLFELVTQPCTACLDLLLNRGVPIDYPDDAEYTVMMRAMDCQDYDMAQWLVSRGASVQVEAYNGVTPAYSVQFHLNKYKVGSPTYKKVLRLKEMMQERGAVFPPLTPAEVRAKRGIKEDPRLYQH